jgi:hypothetical protein
MTKRYMTTNNVFDYLDQARLIRLTSEKKWAALIGWKMEGEGETPPPSPSTPPTGDDPAARKIEEQIKVLEATLAKERQERKNAEAEAKKAHQYRTALGELDPARLDEIHSALDLQKKHEETLARAKSEAIAERDQHYSSQVKALEAEKQSVLEQHNGLKKRLAIQRYFTQTEVAGRPSELESFINLCGGQFDFDPETDQITKVKDSSGQEIFIGGKSATPADLMLQLRQGKQGFAIQSCFTPYNQSSGGGLPLTGANGQPVGDWRQLSKEQIGALAFSQSKN